MSFGTEYNNATQDVTINNLINTSNLMSLVKEALGIIETSTMKDKEIYMLIESAIIDLDRVGIDAQNHILDSLVKNAITLYVKAHFGDIDVEKKESNLKRYKSILRELQNSEEYQKEKQDDSS